MLFTYSASYCLEEVRVHSEVVGEDQGVTPDRSVPMDIMGWHLHRERRRVPNCPPMGVTQPIKCMALV